MALLQDHGTVLSLSTATSPALGTSYNTTGSTSIYAGVASGMQLTAHIVIGTATSLTLKLHGTRDGTNWYDLLTTLESDGTTSLEHAFTASGYYCIQTTAHRYSLAVRVVGKGAGSFNSSDLISVTAVSA